MSHLPFFLFLKIRLTVKPDVFIFCEEPQAWNTYILALFVKSFHFEP